MADDKLVKLFENYLKSSYRTTPVRSPFSHTAYHSSGRVTGANGWMNLTELYNTTYRRIHQEEGFERVMYNEPLNMMVMWPKEDAEGFGRIDEDAVVQLGLKTARGYAKDYRWLDESIPGSGKIAVGAEDADELINQPFEKIREIRPKYGRNLGQIPVERLDESVNPDDSNIGPKIHRMVEQEIDDILSSERSIRLNLNEEKNRRVRQRLRKRQIEEDVSKFEDILTDICARQLREGDKISNVEKALIEEALK